jgi:hypothetical protein
MKMARFLAVSFALLTALGSVPPAHADSEPTVDARLFAVPVMEPGKAAWVSVYDQFGRPVPNAVISVNGSPVEADNMGQASFTVPETAVLTLGLQGSDGKVLAPSKYERSAGGYLVAEKQAQEAVDRIEESVVSNEQAPSIAYAPSVIETSQAFVLMGKNWSGKADGDHVLVDGYDADVFSGSSVCLLATAPRRMSVGAIREMYVTTGDETSNTVEVDVCKLDTVKIGDKARLKVLGSNVPSLIDVRNLTPNTVALKFLDRTLGQKCALITSGGESNSVDLDVQRKGDAPFEIDAHLVADAPWSPDDRNTFDDSNKRKIVAELNKSEVIRLKRRLIAIEQRIGEEQDKRTKGLAEGSLGTAEVDRINAQLRTLSNRQRRINAMVVARRAVYQALGGTEEEYRKALDLAAGGGAIALDKTLAPLACAALLASTSSVGNSTHSTAASLAIEQAVHADRHKEMQQLAELTRMWKQFPTKVAHGTRLAPPPPPYIPNLSGVEGEEISFDYKNMVRLGAPPPPPPLVALMKQQQRNRHSTKASLSRKHSRPKSKLRAR